MSLDHYAEAWSPREGGCYRFVTDEAGRPSPCPEPPVWRGIFRDGRSRSVMVKACDAHRAGMEHVRRISSK